jgi:uncharacterized protein (TIGR04255 family)
MICFMKEIAVPIELAPHPLAHLSRAPLRSAVAELRYAPLLAVEQPDNIERFRNALPEGFLLADRTFAQGLSVTVGVAGLSLGAPTPPGTVWHFRTEDGSTTVHLGITSCAIEVSEYHDWPRFSEIIAAMARALGDALRPQRLLRVGLRYINQIDDPRLEDRRALGHFIRSDLVGGVGEDLGYDAETSFHELRLRQPDGVFVLRHGLVGATTYLLDLDYFDEGDSSFDAAAILSTLERYHQTVESVFVWTLATEYRTELQEVEQ